MRPTAERGLTITVVLAALACLAAASAVVLPALAQVDRDFVDPYGGFSEDCDPYLFNRGADARPLAMFFDGSVRSLRTGDVEAADAQVLDQTGGVDGLWSRDTPLGENGYFGDLSVDGTNVSHNVLTTDGILGRDTPARPAAKGRAR